MWLHVRPTQHASRDAMKIPRLRWILLSVPVAFVALIAHSLFVAPEVAASQYKSRWIERFSAYTSDGSVPGEWRDRVARRSLPSGEWLLAAMHHGACAPGPDGTFDASVILDSAGVVSFCDWSPCAGGVSDIVEFWGELQPASSLADFYGRHTKWSRVQRTSTR